MSRPRSDNIQERLRRMNQVANKFAEITALQKLKVQQEYNTRLRKSLAHSYSPRTSSYQR